MLKIKEDASQHRFRHEAMATEVQLWLGGVDFEYAKQVAYECFQRIDEVESKLSLYQESSDVTRINRARADEVVTVSSECIECLQLASRASALSGGLFNPFLGREALFAKGNAPSFLSLGERVAGRGDLAAIEIDPATRRVRKGLDGWLLDLGGVGKGYALDACIEILDDWEVEVSLFSIGGSTLLFRSTDRGERWEGTLGDAFDFSIGRGALASSGLGFQEEHIIDPASGQSGCLWSRSYAHADSAGLADAMSTAAMLMPLERIQAANSGSSPVALAVEDEEGRLIEGSRFVEAFDPLRGRDEKP
ncbi:FAD:protein FMN transferase [Pelagicoccus sp. SDUM812003]|uniref:FAD:protein FMN transferase n=1 Tax=Pelagicoccus sp. SDUM812003 TaxID=3041267 RepID=UPI0028103C36|nr:FAD:protein FMN transferase [Pelagicoccus sp. SDUM812003]MDQ8201611.1 FAD:protein FMN transferase [Pelagicoccus sp. SDUM812003]